MKVIFNILIGLISFLSLETRAEIVPDAIDSANNAIYKVTTALKNGAFGQGSGVAIGNNELVTNCHVVAGSSGAISVSKGMDKYTARTVKADWYHDVCVLQVEDFEVPFVKIADSNNAEYGDEVFNAGFPGFSPAISNSIGVVSGKFNFDGSYVIRSSSVFAKGQSGGGLFDSSGNLLGIITLKSPGRSAMYYNMPSRWIVEARLLDAIPVSSDEKQAFWQSSEKDWPFFMKVVHPLVSKEWEALELIAKDWIAKEPKTGEAWYVLGLSELNQGKKEEAELHFNAVLSLKTANPDAIYQLSMLEEESGKHIEAMNHVAMLELIDSKSAESLKLALNSK